jgi:hypothetical protein
MVATRKVDAMCGDLSSTIEGIATAEMAAVVRDVRNRKRLF